MPILRLVSSEAASFGRCKLAQDTGMSEDNAFKLHRRYDLKHNNSLPFVQAKRSWLHQYIFRVSDSAYLVVVFAILTVYSLLGDDFRSWVCPKSSDNGFHWMTGFCLVVFFLEMGE